MAQPTPQELREAVNNWNEKYPPGTWVRRYALINPRSEPTGDTTTRSSAWIMGGHSAVCLIHGYSGAMHLDSLEVLREGEMPSNITPAPFSPEQEEALKKWQACDWGHALEHCDVPMTVHKDGMHCAACNHLQRWVPTVCLQGPPPNPGTLFQTPKVEAPKRAAAFFVSDMLSAVEAVYGFADAFNDGEEFIKAVIVELQRPRKKD